MLLGSQYSRYIESVTLLTGRVIRVGDTVDLMPIRVIAEMNKRAIKRSRRYDAKYKRYKIRNAYGNAKQHYLGTLSFIGRGPYKIKRILLWPCGRVMIYLDMPHGREPGVYAEDFI